MVTGPRLPFDNVTTGSAFGITSTHGNWFPIGYVKVISCMHGHKRDLKVTLCRPALKPNVTNGTGG